MTPERWQRVKEAVADALERGAAERSAFLREALGDDPEALREAESMLRHATDETWMEGAVDELSLPGEEAAQARLGERVGDYRILQEIGRGGMGAVYRAERADEEFKKTVAIKILKRGTDTDEVLRRFQRERQILARLEHPNIARLLDAGTTEDGLPYFVMEFVEGERITDYCDKRQLEIRERIELFLKACDAVQFAHRNLIVHRDLKPANILVPADGEPKLLDFGIARLLAPEGHEVQLTIEDRPRLTPGYASPEQVRGEQITTASDVYALGALLYDLLTGRSPHRFPTATPASGELLRVIVDEEIPRASAAASSPETRRALRGDLDNILLTALRKEPEQRYSGVTALSDDLRRYLDGRPVRARPATVGYRASKFIRRNKLGVTAAILLLLTLLGGIVATAWQARQANLERARAERRFNEVRELARSVLFDYHDPIAALPGSTAVREKLVSDALRYLDRLARESGEEIDLLRELAEAYERVSAVQGGVTGNRAGGIASAANLGDVQGALESQKKAVALRERILAMEPENRSHQVALADANLQLGGLYLLAGPPEKAIEAYRQVDRILAPLLGATPTDRELRLLSVLNKLSTAKALGSPGVANLGDTKGALALLHEVVAAYEKLVAESPADLDFKQALMNANNSLALVFRSLGETQKEMETNLRAIEIGREIAKADPSNTFFRRELAVQIGNMGSAKMGMKDAAGALPFFQEALAIFDDLVTVDPHDASRRRQWAVAHRNMGVAIGTQNPERATTHLNQAREILAELVQKNPENADFRRQWAFTHLATSRFDVERKEPESAVRNAQEGIRLTEALVADSPTNASAWNTLALLYRQLGHSEAQWTESSSVTDAEKKQHWQEAKGSYEKTLALYEEMKTKGTLSGADAGKIEELRGEIAKADEAVRAVE